MQRGVLVLGAAVFVVFAALLGACSSQGSGESPLVAPISGRLPEISGSTLTGGSIAPADYRGKVVVLTFWNPDCPPCRKEMPALRADWAALRPLGVQFISVLYVGGDWPRDLDGAKEYLAEEGLSYPGVVDEDSSLARAAHIPGIPVTIVADASGAMRYQILGGVKPGEVIGLVSRLSQKE
jgi:cytochrome c biogenesis protein CcmG/thiol:disulfide interchange protein DsbE